MASRSRQISHIIPISYGSGVSESWEQQNHAVCPFSFSVNLLFKSNCCLLVEEFVTHSPGNVTCLTIGRKSARILATGGEDRLVKLWAVGKPTCIKSLSGHTSTIQSAQFSENEQFIAAGSLSGSIRIWDLEKGKCR